MRQQHRLAHAAVPDPHAALAALGKCELHALADLLLQAAPDPWAVDRCVEFVLADTRGLWHGRARAMMCRRLKHCALGRTHRSALVACIGQRLERGDFSEQFKDQLRLALRLDAPAMLAICRKSLASPRPHVRRYAQWALALPGVAG